jgi:hypothetical protein
MEKPWNVRPGLFLAAYVRYSFSMRTRGDQLAHAVAYALRRVRIPGRRGSLSEAERYRVADTLVAKLKENGDPWRLSEELPRFFHGPPTQGYR